MSLRYTLKISDFSHIKIFILFPIQLSKLKVEMIQSLVADGNANSVFHVSYIIVVGIR